ncbi:protein kinase family protein [Gloeothece verrucosa]|uniref:Serine/threonine protein kinase n=1 Tax=Gloeothece verrucosa (strain PCC 7822) TaxID=497965 RepID=E0UF08_GLOV7|nr:protein kinase family protein [Gloeothece verrucosa]ADN14260.1 serine/threonine protein kinase [Gloeothece verrucosa PCC 7822]
MTIKLFSDLEWPLPKKFQSPKKGEIIINNDSKDQYIIGKRINNGNFGNVYECWDEWGNELVAKVLKPNNQTYKKVREDWEKELNKLITLRHPNITYIYDCFEYRNTFYLILERCHRTFKEMIEIYKYENDFLDYLFPYIARDILQAIHFIHQVGYVHKDLHLGNVFVHLVKDKLLPDNTPVWIFKIGDLGISNLEADIDIFNTTLAAWMLPPEYLDPQEYAIKDNGEYRLTKQIDIYHTGLLLLSVLLGYTPPFTEQEILQGSPRQMAENLPLPYGQAIAKALRRHVEFRTQTALKFWQDIKAAIPST